MSVRIAEHAFNEGATYEYRITLWKIKIVA